MFVVMSDSHSERHVIENIKARYANTASAIFHCGDSELPSDDKIWENVTVVAGNCDFDDGYDNFVTKNIEGKTILITHGHLFNVGFGLDKYSYFAEEKNADIALFGHIHRPVAQIIGKTLFLNPGSVAQPRGDYNIKMYAIVAVTENGYKISYRDLQHREIPDLQFEFEL